MSSPAVSVIIPAFNCGELVRQAADSVRAQTYRDFEVILVDDGSTDDTWRVLGEIVAGWPEARALHCEHKGLAAARNRGIADMRGEWIALLDADDLWLPEKLKRCVAFLIAHPHLRIVYTPMDLIRLDGSRMKGHSKCCHAGWLTDRLFHSIFVHDPATVFHKGVVEVCGGFDESLEVCVGHEFWLRVSTKFEFGLIDEPLALRRWHEKSLTRSNRVRARVTKSAMMDRFYFERGGREILRDAKAARRRLARVHCSTGKILLRQRQMAAAQRYFAKAIGLAPGLLRAYPFHAVSAAGKLLGL